MISGALEALIYMERDEGAFGARPRLRPVAWRVARALGQSGEAHQIQAEVRHDLPPDGSGERGLAELAVAQHGLVTRRQLGALGFSAKAIEHRVRTARLHRVHQGVFAVGHPCLAPLASEAAALLCAGDNSVLSHDSAAALWGLITAPSLVSISVIDRHIRRRPGLCIHRVKTLDIRDVCLHRGFPVTSPARTLLDCAATSLPLDRLLNEARALKLVKDSEFREAMQRCPRRKGARPLRALLEAEQDTGFTRSEAERILKRLVKEARLERPVFNTRVMGVEVDAYWPRLNVVIEVDGYDVHGHWAAFQRDRAKANRLVAAGFVVLRFTWHQLTKTPLVVVAEIARTMSVRSYTNPAVRTE